MNLENYRTDAIHVFQIHSLNVLNKIPRVVLLNKSFKNSELETNYIVDICVRFSSGEKKKLKKVGIVIPHGIFVWDCRELVLEEKESECIITFSLIPERYYGQEGVTLSQKEAYYYLTCQDHYLEYYNESGITGGVLYQSAPFNYKKFSKETSTVIQAPKVHLSLGLKTMMSFVNSSVEDDYQVIAELNCVILDPSGCVVRRWKEEILPHSVKIIDFSSLELVELESNINSFSFYAVTSNAVLLPLTILLNQISKGVSLEHSLPPMYYSSEARGAIRSKMVMNFEKSLKGI